MARTKIKIKPNQPADFIRENKDFRDFLVGKANDVRAEAERTAPGAEGSPPDRTAGYAAAGFRVQFEARGRRPRVNIISNASPDVAQAVYWYTQKRDGVAHLRQALYSQIGKD